jgi:hypothetical protein
MSCVRTDISPVPREFRLARITMVWHGFRNPWAHALKGAPVANGPVNGPDNLYALSAQAIRTIRAERHGDNAEFFKQRERLYLNLQEAGLAD